MESELSYVWSQYNKIGTSIKHLINTIGYSEQLYPLRRQKFPNDFHATFQLYFRLNFTQFIV